MWKNPGLSPYGRIDGAQQGGGHVDKPDAPFEAGGGKSAQVGNHASAQVYEQRLAAGPVAAQLVPHVGESLEGLVGIARLDVDVSGRVGERLGHQGQRQLPGVGVAEDKEVVGGNALDFAGKCLAGLCGEYQFLRLHRAKGIIGWWYAGFR